jgi:hypothetical protein
MLTFGIACKAVLGNLVTREDVQCMFPSAMACFDGVFLPVCADIPFYILFCFFTVTWPTTLLTGQQYCTLIPSRSSITMKKRRKLSKLSGFRGPLRLWVAEMSPSTTK